MSERSDLLVVGAGIVGLTTAFEVARTGRAVTIVDDAPGFGATFAAAGMLAPGAEWSPEHGSLTTRSMRALAAWPEHAERISTISNLPVELESTGSLFIGWNAGDRHEHRRYFEHAASYGILANEVARDTDPELFQHVSDRVRSGFFVASDAYVDADQVVGALLVACQRLGVNFVAGRAQFLDSNTEATVAVDDATFVATKGIVATGYVDDPPLVLAGSQHKIRPVRGVTIRLRVDAPVTTPAAIPMLRGSIEGRTVYVITRNDGSVVVGATSEESSERVVDVEAVRRLLNDACALMPGLDAAEFVDARVGLRPASDDQLPFFERQSGTQWAWSNGHFRHGFLLSSTIAPDALEFMCA